MNYPPQGEVVEQTSDNNALAPNQTTDILPISIIVPTYNERNNIELLLSRLSQTLSTYKHEFVVVDDNSPDKTYELVEQLSSKYPIKLIKRAKREGLASAILNGFNTAKGQTLAVIDADLQHPPEVIRTLIEQIPYHDIVVASRYIKGGKVKGWSLRRRLVSNGATLLARPLTKVKDSMSGYFAIKREIIRGIPLVPTGYKILLEVLVKGRYKRVIEVPYTFQGRLQGQSKLGFSEYIKYIRLLFHLYKYKFVKIKNTSKQHH